MANIRQYIGARYTIKIYENSQDAGSAEWEANTSYEPLVMVTYNNSSYLSKKDVPATIGNPAQNPLYWILTGAYNGQIAALQAQIDDINNNKLPAITAQIQALANKKRKYVLIADSYGENYTSGSDNIIGWVDNFIDILGLTSDEVSTDHIYRVSGTGFLGVNSGKGWLNFLTSLTADDDITDVIIVGGSNDCYFAEVGNDSDLKQAMNETIAMAKTKFSKARISVGFCCAPYTTSSNSFAGIIKNCNLLYNQYCAELGCSIIDKVNTCLTSFDYMVNETHPNNVGTKLIGAVIASYVYGGNVTNGTTFKTVNCDVSDANVTANASTLGIRYTTTDNIMTVDFYGTADVGKIGIGFPSGTTVIADGNRGLSIAKVDELPISKNETRFIHTGMCYADLGGTLKPMSYMMAYWNGYLTIALDYMDANGWPSSQSIEHIYLQSFRETIDLKADVL